MKTILQLGKNNLSMSAASAYSPVPGRCSLI